MLNINYRNKFTDIYSKLPDIYCIKTLIALDKFQGHDEEIWQAPLIN